MARYTRQLSEQIKKSNGTALDMTTWFYLYAFDIIGELAFEKSYGMLKEGKSHSAANILREGMALLGRITPVPWLARIALSSPVPGVVHRWKTMVQWSGKQLEERLEVRVPLKHVFQE